MHSCLRGRMTFADSHALLSCRVHGATAVMGCCAWHRCSMQWRTGCSAIAEPQGPAEAPGSGGGAACQWDAPTAPLLTAAALLSAQAFYCFAPPQ